MAKTDYSKASYTRPLSNLQQAKDKGIPVKYVRFHQPVAPAPNVEPVNEFKVETDPLKRNKYSVDSILKTPVGYVWDAHGHTDMIAELTTASYSRT